MSDINIRQYLKRGPFPDRVDPWTETGSYFSQLHSGLLAAIINQVGDSLLDLGYVISKEATLQIAELRKPDIAIHTAVEKVAPGKHLDYTSAAVSVLAEPGISVEEEEPELQAIYIRQMDSNALITVIEVISPRNKSYIPDIMKYKEGREHLFLAKGINVVEIDLTRSNKRLLESSIVADAPYHIAVFIPGEYPRIIPIEFGEKLKRWALPLLGDVIAVDLQDSYDWAYQQGQIAPQIENNKHYTLDNLPFPTLLTDAQIQNSLEAVKLWREKLTELRKSK